MNILDECLHEVVDIDKMQHGFMSGRGIVDAVFDMRKLTENIRAKNKKLLFICRPGTGFDQVQREVAHFALRQKGVPEYSVDGVMSLYKGCKTRTSVDGELSSSISVKVGVCLESALSLFIYHGNRCSDRMCEGWFIIGVVVCR